MHRPQRPAREGETQEVGDDAHKDCDKEDLNQLEPHVTDALACPASQLKIAYDAPVGLERPCRNSIGLISWPVRRKRVDRARFGRCKQVPFVQDCAVRCQKTHEWPHGVRQQLACVRRVCRNSARGQDTVNLVVEALHHAVVADDDVACREDCPAQQNEPADQPGELQGESLFQCQRSATPCAHGQTSII